MVVWCCAGGSATAADRNTTTEQPAGAHVTAMLCHARHLPGKDRTPQEDVLHDLGQSVLTKSSFVFTIFTSCISLVHTFNCLYSRVYEYGGMNDFFFLMPIVEGVEVLLALL